ncbi:ribulokinase [Olivibacter sitiensis]|uniref:ribulokinase n=1 Tax=Olivibacter sitiensis TaxID=376470 RepID=UPI0004898986|nr:ribulokinase [Olivibacter sitiensis]
MQSTYVIGLDFGTDSVRALVVDALTGEEMGMAVSPFARWAAGLYCSAAKAQFRQHPLDYLESMERGLRAVLTSVSQQVRDNIVGISVDATGSTPVAVDEYGTPLSLLPEFSDNPNAMFILWKDHTANAEAAEINELAKRWETDFTQYVGGSYSSEWFWSKILHIIRKDNAVSQRAFSWVEQCDWLSAVLTGNTNPLEIKRSRCAAGHKAMWHQDFGGLPTANFLQQLDGRLAQLRNRLYQDTYTADHGMGKISLQWAEKLGLSPAVKVGVGAIDAHMGAVGACIAPYSLVKVMGTSTCDMLVAPTDKHGGQFVRGICGQVNGSIIPDMLGFEAGQSAFGDLYQWFANLLSFPLTNIYPEKLSAEEQNGLSGRILSELNKEAALVPLTVDDEIALDWINGRRTPDVDLNLTAVLSGLHLGSSPARIFKALVEATAYGSRAIIERFEKEGIPVQEVIALGGISKKSPYVMQTLANVLNRPIKTVRSEQACALGAAMYAAVVSGIHADISSAQRAMSSGFEQTYLPEQDKVAIYETLYPRYLILGDKFYSHKL